MTETLVEYTARVSADYEANIKPRVDWRSDWPTRPADQQSGETVSQYHVRIRVWIDQTYRPWYDALVPPPAQDPQYSGGTGQRRPPPQPPQPRQ